MPTYEYECTSESCGHKFELFQSITAKPVRKCPQCGNSAKRLIGAGAGIIFRGSGFYITDYRKKDYAEKAKADSAPSSPAPEKKAESKKESKSSSSSSDA